MWPWGHAAIGYLVYASLTVGRRRRAPTNREIVVLLFGTQFPDLIDKPLAWTFGLLPAGRSLAHSLLTATVVITLVVLVSRRYAWHVVPGAFSTGYLIGILTDVPREVFAGEFAGATFLLWPLLPAPTYGTEPSFLAHFRNVELTPWFLLQAGLFAVMVGVWFGFWRHRTGTRPSR